MADQKTVYIKCYREKRTIDIDLVRRYDQKYYYLVPSHPDSKFTSERRAKLLGDFAEANFSDYNFPTTAKDLADFAEISTVKAIALLIEKGCRFDIANEEWSPGRSAEVDKPAATKYVISTAQCNAETHPFFQSLLYYCHKNDAELIVLPLYYGVQPESEEAEFDQRVVPYLLEEKQVINDVQILADLRNTATAVNPLSGLKPITQGKTIIVPSTHIMMERVPVPMGERPIGMWATGACTVESYRKNTKAGYKGDFHHTQSAILLEFDDDGTHYVRNLPGCSQTGLLFDLGEVYSGYSNIDVRFDSVLGDLHCGSTCPVTMRGYDNLISDIGRKPDFTVAHDILDGEQVNHHEAGNPFAKFKHTFKSLSDELAANKILIDNLKKKCGQLVIVASNHNDFLNRWLKRVDWRQIQDPTTAQIYLRAASLTSEGLMEDFYTNEMIMRGVKGVMFLKEGQQFSPKGVNYGHHGDKGAGGARGSILAFSHLGEKVVIAHSHKDGIYKNAFQVSTFTKLDLGYNKGLSGWTNGLCLIHEGGKRQLVELYKGKYKP